MSEQSSDQSRDRDLQPIGLDQMVELVEAGKARRVTDARSIEAGQLVYGHCTTSGSDDPAQWSEYVPMQVERAWKYRARLFFLHTGTSTPRSPIGPATASTWELAVDEVFALVLPAGYSVGLGEADGFPLECGSRHVAMLTSAWQHGPAIEREAWEIAWSDVAEQAYVKAGEYSHPELGQWSHVGEGEVVRVNGLGYALHPVTGEPMMAHPRSRKVRDLYRDARPVSGLPVHGPVESDPSTVGCQCGATATVGQVERHGVAGMDHASGCEAVKSIDATGPFGLCGNEGDAPSDGPRYSMAVGFAPLAVGSSRPILALVVFVLAIVCLVVGGYLATRRVRPEVISARLSAYSDLPSDPIRVVDVSGL